MLVHICCSVDSHFFLQELRKILPHEKFIGYFYDPNIHPFSEYELRFLDVKRSCDKLGITLLKGEYDMQSWFEATKGLELEPEKGKRCMVCFDHRLEQSAKMAVKIGEKTLTTTLLTSPKKSLTQLNESLQNIAKKYDLDIFTPDFRKNGGTSRQFELAKKDKLYHQNYCGCMFALSAQRKAQEKLHDELISAYPKRKMPGSIHERIKLYERVIKCEEKGQDFRLIRESFLNYRLLFAKVQTHENLPSFFLFYSHLKREKTQGFIEFSHEGIGYFNRENIIFIELEKFNKLAKTSYQNISCFYINPPKTKLDLKVRRKITQTPYSINPIIVVNKLPEDKISITCKSVIYQDSKEILLKI